MIKFIAITALLVLAFTYGEKRSNDLKGLSLKTKMVLEPVLETVKLPMKNTSLSSKGLKIKKARRILVLGSKNLLSFRGPITSESVAVFQQKLLKMSNELDVETDIYITLDTVGGSIFEGVNLIEFAKALPQKVHTISLFAASMGFQITQSLDRRFISYNGTLMSHRGYLGGFEGQLDGEFETRLRSIKRMILYLDTIAAKRMGISLEAYKTLIKDEYWTYGFDAVSKEERAADELVKLQCGKSLNGTEELEIVTLFGDIKVTFSKCPLIRGVLKTDFGEIEESHKRKIGPVIDMMFNKRKAYVREFILTNKHYNYFGL